MVDRNIANKLGLSQEKLQEQVDELFGEGEGQYLEQILQKKVDSRLPGSILSGTIVSQIGNDVIVEVGLKSEGVVDANEFPTPEDMAPGTEIEVLLEDTDSESGLILLSKRKADIIRGWEHIINTKKEGDVVSGRVIRRIKGGLLVDIGVPVFLPASQVDIRKPGDISRFIGKEVECKVLKIDVDNRNIVVSRRKLIEEERRASKEKILTEIEVGQLRKGVVKNIADFGVFVDLGGLDGLLHISDLSWGRISHPSEVVNLDQDIEVVVIGVDKEHEKISLGLKQKTPSPWETVEEKYPVSSKVQGKVVNVMNYGVFVRLEDGIEGLVHISEMSWTRRLSHPSEMVNLGDEIEVVVLSVNKEKQEISLGMKQTEPNPWEVAARKYPAGTIVNAVVRSMTNFGAFLEIEPGIDGMIHISDLSWTRKFGHPSEALQKGQEVRCVVLEVNEEKQRISLGMKQMSEDPWIRAIPEKYIPGHIIKGKIAKLTNFGAFVELEQDLEGLLHISELADHKIDKPQDVVKPGDDVEVKILKVDPEARKIGLSLRRVQWAAEEHGTAAPARKTVARPAPVVPAGPPKIHLAGPGGHSGDTLVIPTRKPVEPEKPAAEPEAPAAETAPEPEKAAAEPEAPAAETAPEPEKAAAAPEAPAAETAPEPEKAAAEPEAPVAETAPEPEKAAAEPEAPAAETAPEPEKAAAEPEAPASEEAPASAEETAPEPVAEQQTEPPTEAESESQEKPEWA